MQLFKVTFKKNDFVFCQNVAKANSAEEVKKHYAKYEWCSVDDLSPYEMETVKAKNIPVIEIA